MARSLQDYHMLGRAVLLAAVLLAAVLFAAAACNCPEADVDRAAQGDLDPEPDLSDRPSSLEPPPREPGPGRPESSTQLEQARAESRALSAALLRGGVSRREVASLADIRGYRLYRRRCFGQARIWFEAAVASDPTYEPSLLNAARCATLTGDIAAARRHLATLQRLDTPLARSRLHLALQDPDLKPAFSSSLHAAEPARGKSGPADRRAAPNQRRR